MMINKTLLVSKVLIICAAVFSGVFVHRAYADGMFISDRELHLYEPDQKAVIHWDGIKETMILSSAIRSEDIANFAWVIPIQSSAKPIVSASNSKIFEDIVDYFARDKGRTTRGTLSFGAGVEVFEFKEIDVYDIVILKAASAQDLIKWSKENGYKVPDKAIPVLDRYIKRGDCYFIITKIDLRNRFSKEIDELNEIYENIKIKYKKLCDQLTQAFYDYGFDDSVYHFDYRNDPKWKTREDCCFLVKGYGDGVLEIFKKYLNTELNKRFKEKGISPKIIIDLGNGLRIQAALEVTPTLDSSGFSYICDNLHFDIFDAKYGALINQFKIYPLGPNNKIVEFKGTDIERIKHYYIDDGYMNKRYRQLPRLAEKQLVTLKNFLELKGPNYKLLIKEIQKRNEILIEVIPIVVKMREFFGPSFNDLLKELCSYSYSLDYDDYDYDAAHGGRSFSNLSYGAAVLEIVGFNKKFDKLYSVISDLERGMAVPLKIEFQPPEPYYPLEISSLLNTKGFIGVYVISEEPIFDSNKMLSVDESKEINQELKNKLAEYLKLDNAAYITRLVFDDEFKKLTYDAFFKNKK
jgi:hypothetical protein